jgi:hypothetical protein
MLRDAVTVLCDAIGLLCGAFAMLYDTKTVKKEAREGHERGTYRIIAKLNTSAFSV